jgi:hypothetical protein
MTINLGYPSNYPSVYSHTWQTQGWTIQEIPLPNQNDVITAFQDVLNYDLIANSGTPGVLVKGTTARLFVLLIVNTNQITTHYIRLYNKASAPVVGTDVSFLTVPVLPGDGILLTSNAQVFPLGLGIGVTGGPGDTDTTPVVSDVLVHVVYN